jgi:hypothetical protein
VSLSARERGELSVQTRVARAMLKRDLKRGLADIGDLLGRPPEYLRGVALFDMVLMAPYCGPRRLERIGFEALGARINLAQPVDVAPLRARLWLAQRLQRRGR